MNWTMIGAVLGALAVAAGAFGAHGLQSRVTPERLQVFETAARYHMYHALALLAVGSLQANAAGWAILAGTAIFSGSLYLLVLLDKGWLGAVTPIGGLALIIGWILLAVAASKT